MLTKQRCANNSKMKAHPTHWPTEVQQASSDGSGQQLASWEPRCFGDTDPGEARQTQGLHFSFS